MSGIPGEGGVRPIPEVCWPDSSVNLVTPDSLRDLVPQKLRWGTTEQDTRSRSLASTRPMHLHEKEKKLRQTCIPSLTLVCHQTVELVSKPESVARVHLCPCRVTEPHLAPSLLRRDSLPCLPWSLQMVGQRGFEGSVQYCQYCLCSEPPGRRCT